MPKRCLHRQEVTYLALNPGTQTPDALVLASVLVHQLHEFSFYKLLRITLSFPGLFLTLPHAIQLKPMYTQLLKIHLQVNTPIRPYVDKTLISTLFLPIYSLPAPPKKRSAVKGIQNIIEKANASPFQKMYPIITPKTCNFQATRQNSILD